MDVENYLNLEEDYVLNVFRDLPDDDFDKTNDVEDNVEDVERIRNELEEIDINNNEPEREIEQLRKAIEDFNSNVSS